MREEIVLLCDVEITSVERKKMSAVIIPNPSDLRRALKQGVYLNTVEHQFMCLAEANQSVTNRHILYISWTSQAETSSHTIHPDSFTNKSARW